MNYVTYLLIATTSLCTLFGQLLLKKAVNGPSMRAALSDGPVSFVLSAAYNPWVWAALMLQVMGYVVWFFVLTREKLAVSLALGGAVLYLLSALAAWMLYGERLGLSQWCGITLVALGVMLLTLPR